MQQLLRDSWNLIRNELVAEIPDVSFWISIEESVRQFSGKNALDTEFIIVIGYSAPNSPWRSEMARGPTLTKAIIAMQKLYPGIAAHLGVNVGGFDPIRMGM